MLESIGFLAIIVIIFYLLIQNTDSNAEKKRIEGELIENSYSCQSLIREFNICHSNGKPLMSNEMLRKKLREIINDPSEKQKITESILNKKAQIKEDQEAKLKRIKVSYKYDEQIFEIFANNRELPKTELLQSIKEKFRFNDVEESSSLFEIWDKNWLISKCDWNKANWEIGWILNRDHGRSVGDLTYNDWLKEHNVILKSKSNEYNEYVESLKDEFPF
jgi:hypothetical protein